MPRRDAAVTRRRAIRNPLDTISLYQDGAKRGAGTEGETGPLGAPWRMHPRTAKVHPGPRPLNNGLKKTSLARGAAAAQ